VTFRLDGCHAVSIDPRQGRRGSMLFSHDDEP
jgi:hypothetical protein